MYKSGLAGMSLPLNLQMNQSNLNMPVVAAAALLQSANNLQQHYQQQQQQPIAIPQPPMTDTGHQPGGVRIHTCPLCPNSFTSAYSLRRHLSKHYGIRPYSCDNCQKSFMQKHHLTQHVRQGVCSNKKPDPPNDITSRASSSHQQQSISAADLRLHVPQNLCRSCGEHFLSRSDLRHHQISMHGHERPFRCVLCADAAFSRKESLIRHVTHVHGKNSSTLIPSNLSNSIMVKSEMTSMGGICVTPDLAINRSNGGGGNAVRDSPRTRQGHNTGNFACPYCNKSLASRWNLQRHVQTCHAGVRLYTCPDCGRPFSQKHHLAIHQRRKHPNSTATTSTQQSQQIQQQQQRLQLPPHLQQSNFGAAPIQPNIVSPYLAMHAFHIQQQPRQHQQRQTQRNTLDMDARPYPCPQCPHRFKSMAHLKQHSFVHAEVKPFQCQICHSIAFTRKYSLVRHIRYVHPQQAYGVAATSQ